jgi:hypothetical protein
MKIVLWMVLLGTSFLIPAEAFAQRGRNADVRVVAPERSARLAHCRAPSNGRAYVCRSEPNSRVVYRYASTTRPQSARVWITPSWARVRVDFRRHDVRRGEIDQRWLRDVVGKHTIRRVREHGHDAGLRGPVRGHWVARGHDDVLVLTMERQEVARLIDRDLDGRVDVFLLRNFRRW